MVRCFIVFVYIYLISRKLLESPRPPLNSTVTSIRDPFSREMSLTCFPIHYPPPPDEPISSPRMPLVTQFHCAASTNNEKPRANRCVDISSLATRFGRMSITTSEVGFRTQDNQKCIWAPRSKKPEPLSPLLSPVTAGVSDPSPKLPSPNTGTVLCAKSITAPRRRRIAALPTRHTKTVTLDSSSPSANPPVSAATSNKAMPHAPFSWVAEMTVTETTRNSSTSSPATVQNGLPSQVQFTTGTDILGSKPVVSEPRKRLPRPRPRRVASQPQTTASQRRPSIHAVPSGQRTSHSTVSRTPSLVSDTSSCADSFTSSDEFDTPPSTPPYSHGFTACNALATSVISSRPNSIGPFGLPIPCKR